MLLTDLKDVQPHDTQKYKGPHSAPANHKQCEVIWTGLWQSSKSVQSTAIHYNSSAINSTFMKMKTFSFWWHCQKMLKEMLHYTEKYFWLCIPPPLTIQPRNLSFFNQAVTYFLKLQANHSLGGVVQDGCWGILLSSLIFIYRRSCGCWQLH